MADNNMRGRERDLILAPNEYAYILDETKGNVINYVGPHKTSLANTDQPVVFNEQTKRFEHCNLEQAVQNFAIAPEGWYLVLKNPSKDQQFARVGTANNLPDLNIGRKINTPGPVAFAPWPGQMVRIIQGHRLRSNQYLIVRVYDEEAARENWEKAVIKPQLQKIEENPQITTKITEEMPDLTMGKLLVIKGTEVSFYIPPTGIEVVTDENNLYVRTAVTLEQLEYCILLDENGSKRYIRGPAVVFPKPTENFIEQHNSRKFKAIELNEISGLYIKVISSYEENGQHFKVGDELFVTGKEQMIYFPRAEHAIVRYGENEVNYAIAIPAGEARYVLDRLTGQITLKRGATIFLPDPRKEVIVRRILELKQVMIWFPNNQEALEYNLLLKKIATGQKNEYINDQEARGLMSEIDDAVSPQTSMPKFVGDEFQRQGRYTPPRTVTLDTKYEGAVAINVWTGYAILIVSKTGDRKVFVGPGTYLLEYDEILEAISLSTGTPKSDNKLERTVYLKVTHNKISDVVEAETADLCPIEIYLSYRVNFEGEPDKWFQIENYVKFLTEHLRSILRNALKRYGVEEFYAKAISIIRDTVLGIPDEKSHRAGRLFHENGMKIYDVEILNVSITDQKIASLLIDAQHNTVKQTLELSTERKALEVAKEKEQIKQFYAQAEAATQQIILSLKKQQVEENAQLKLAEIQADAYHQQIALDNKLTQQTALDKIHAATLLQHKEEQELELAFEQTKLTQQLEYLKAEVDAVVNKAQAISPQLIATLQSFSERALAEKVAETMSPLAILGGKSVAEVFAQLLKGTILEKVISNQVGEE
jgi:major vault protein